MAAPPPPTCLARVATHAVDLYIGTAEARQRLDLLRERGIRRVISLQLRDEWRDAAYPDLPDDVKQRHYVLADHPDAAAHLLTIVDECAAAGVGTDGVPTLVHCTHGISRSAALVVGLLGLPVDTALAVLRQTWPRAAPNDSFVAALRGHERSIERAWLEVPGIPGAEPVVLMGEDYPPPPGYDPNDDDWTTGWPTTLS